MDKAVSSQVVSSPGRELASSLTDSSQVVSSRGHWEQAREAWLTCDLCELEAADHCFGRKSLTSKDHFWKGSYQSLVVWKEEIITL
ncbi:UNVERIFIED_CONTAM: hypothetical protein Sradi_0482800 [Sesamum radiatum]|uniref:Uncharacterized protein n=1 Tax=Sesamum radiatum TaxID=300843 RepID=A0AAW2W7M9_SESRA